MPSTQRGRALTMGLLALLALLSVSCVRACVFKFGTEPNPLSPHKIHFDYSFAGADWVDAEFLQQDPNYKSICTSGKQQSPINIPQDHMDELSEIPANLRTTLNLGNLTSNGTNVQVFNNGHTIQVQWSGANNAPTISVAAPVQPGNPGPVGPLNSQVLRTSHTNANITWQRLTLYPLQFHFHAHSEHLVDGHMFPLELHIVTQTKPGQVPGCSDTTGCLSVVGIMLEVDPDTKEENPFVKTIFDAMPSKDGAVVNFPAGTVLDFADVTPGDQTYFTYEGSLTTPPCSEGILWHVMTHPIKITLHQLEQYMNATGDSDCEESARRRHLLAEPIASTSTSYTCTKLGAGQNYRVVQPVLERTIKLFRDPAAVRTARLAPVATDLQFSKFMKDASVHQPVIDRLTTMVSDKTGVPESHIDITFYPESAKSTARIIPEATLSMPVGWSAEELALAAIKLQDEAGSSRMLIAEAGLTNPTQANGVPTFMGVGIGAGAGVMIGAVAVLAGLAIHYKRAAAAKAASSPLVEH